MTASDPASNSSEALQLHISSTYWTLRYGMAVVAFALPIVVFAVAYFFGGGVGLQDSMSDYYWAPRIEKVRPPARDFFVGGLFALAVFFYLYKGFSWKENWALNAAAALALGVAIFPMAERPGVSTDDSRFSLHGFCAVTMFLVLVYVVWRRAKDTLPLVPAGAKPSADDYLRRYRIIGAVMLVSPLTAFALSSIVRKTSYVFFIEAAGIWAFAWYWWSKSKEMKASSATARALLGELEKNAATDALQEASAPGAAKPEERVRKLDAGVKARGGLEGF